MKESTTIRVFIASLLLLLFAFSSAPRSFFHDLLTDHQDALSCIDLHSTTVLHEKAMDCDCDELVVTSPFVVEQVAVNDLPTALFKQQFQSFYNNSSQSFVQYSESRGPPAGLILHG